MATGSGDEEREWAADKRAFVADWRDEIADERDNVADVRDGLAQDREAELDAWERHLVIRDAEFGGHAGDPEASAQHSVARPDRSRAEGDRNAAEAERTVAAADRHDATKRREADARPTRLAMAFAEIAERLYDAVDFDAVLSRIAETAVSTVAGCEMASVTLREPSGYRTAASTNLSATAVDEAQYQSHEGPCLDAVDASMVYAESFPDERWPHLGTRPTDSGVQSALSFRLSTTRSGADDAGGGSLNSYGAAPSAFDDMAQEIGLILAAHASLAARAVEERSNLERLGNDLQQALLSRDVIGQAKGILMERLKITPDVAFEALRNASQHLNVKLREVAREVAETGKLRMPARSVDGQPGHRQPPQSVGP